MCAFTISWKHLRCFLMLLANIQPNNSFSIDVQREYITGLSVLPACESLEASNILFAFTAMALKIFFFYLLKCLLALNGFPSST